MSWTKAWFPYVCNCRNPVGDCCRSWTEFNFYNNADWITTITTHMETRLNVHNVYLLHRTSTFAAILISSIHINMPKHEKLILDVQAVRANRDHFRHWETRFHDYCLLEGYRDPRTLYYSESTIRNSCPPHRYTGHRRNSQAWNHVYSLNRAHDEKASTSGNYTMSHGGKLETDYITQSGKSNMKLATPISANIHIFFAGQGQERKY